MSYIYSSIRGPFFTRYIFFVRHALCTDITVDIIFQKYLLLVPCYIIVVTLACICLGGCLRRSTASHGILQELLLNGDATTLITHQGNMTGQSSYRSIPYYLKGKRWFYTCNFNISSLEWHVYVVFRYFFKREVIKKCLMVEN